MYVCVCAYNFKCIVIQHIYKSKSSVIHSVSVIFVVIILLFKMNSFTSFSRQRFALHAMCSKEGGGGKEFPMRGGTFR